MSPALAASLACTLLLANFAAHCAGSVTCLQLSPRNSCSSSPPFLSPPAPFPPYASIKIQKDNAGAYKNYSIVYFVWEKVAPCGDYPPECVSCAHMRAHAHAH